MSESTPEFVFNAQKAAALVRASIGQTKHWRVCIDKHYSHAPDQFFLALAGSGDPFSIEAEDEEHGNVLLRLSGALPLDLVVRLLVRGEDKSWRRLLSHLNAVLQPVAVSVKPVLSEPELVMPMQRVQSLDDFRQLSLQLLVTVQNQSIFAAEAQLRQLLPHDALGSIFDEADDTPRIIRKREFF